MGIAIASGVPTAAGLLAGIVGGIVVGVCGGVPLQVSGPAAGLTVVVADAVRAHGLPVLGMVVLIAGVLQVAFGLCRFGDWFRRISPAIVQGMLAGIGVLIFASQFHVMVDDTPKGSGLQNLLSIPEAIRKGSGWPRWESRDQRLLRTSLLQSFGSVHEAQVELEEIIAEEIPRTSSEQTSIDSALLPGLIERQEWINSELNRLASDINRAGLTEDNGAKSQRIIKAVKEANRLTVDALVDLNDSHIDHVRSSQHAAVNALMEVLLSLKNHEWAAKIGLLTIATIVLWRVLFSRVLPFVPAPLVGAVVATMVTTFLVVPVLYVEVPTHLLDNLHPPSTVVQDVPWLTLLGIGLVIAVIASAESLLCANAIDLMKPGPPLKYDRELIAQGLGNCVCGLLGALPIAGVIVRSAANVQAGAKTRLSTILHGIWLVLAVLLLYPLLALIPTSSLAAILVYTGYRLVNLRAVNELRKLGKMEVLIYFATMITIVAFDLLVGLIVGIVLYEIKLLYRFSQFHIRMVYYPRENQANLTMRGRATFLKFAKFENTLRDIPRGANVYVNVSELRYIDQTCWLMFERWVGEHEANGGSVNVDWETLRMKSGMHVEV
jgi:MFS superfamily sulfate permease-like transporter